MGRINNIVKLIKWNMNSNFGLFGLLVIIAALYVLFANWGNLSSNFFLAIGIILVIVGGLFMLITSLGMFGIEFQLKKTGVWTGRRILIVHIMCVLAAFSTVAYILYYSTDQITSLKSSLSSLNNGIALPYDQFETTLSKKFNQFYFGTAAVCDRKSFIVLF
jgi:hypothetical protein